MGRGKFTGVGVGPGDPGLMTLKAIRTIEEADVLILPAADRDSCRAYGIVRAAFEELSRRYGTLKNSVSIDDKECIFMPFPMGMDKDELHDFHKRMAEETARVLDAGKNAAFLTIGDPSVYSTLDYVAVILDEMGYDTKRTGGVTSFCAAADRLGISLGEGNETINIIPGSADVEEALKLGGTKVFMKGGRKLKELRDRLIVYEKETGCRVFGVQNCGLPDEKLAYHAEDIADDWGYMSVVIVLDR